MELWDTIITVAIIAAAAFYVYRKFARTKKSSGGGCGCGSESSCCGAGSGGHSSSCSGQHH